MRPRTRVRADTHDATSPTQHNGTSASWRVSPKTAHANKPRTAHRTLKRRIHSSPARPQDVPHTGSRNHSALRKHHCTRTVARTQHTTRHTAPRTPHTAHRKTHPVTHAASAPHSLQSCQAAQRRRDAAGQLVVVQIQLPAGHTNSHRVTPWHPTPLPDPIQSTATHLSSSHSINQIKSNESQSAHCMLAQAQHRV
jgi:hypothetical protein